MKKALVVVLALALSASVCFAQAMETKEAPVNKAVDSAKTFVGKVLTVTVADPVKGVAKGTVEVAEATGKVSKFTVDSSVKVVDGTMNAVTFNSLKKGDTVAVNADEENNAKSISVTK